MILPKQTWLSFTKFIIGGIVNNAALYPVYLVLNHFFYYQFAFLSSYCLGILFTYWINTGFVFKTQRSWKTFLVYPSIYVFQYIFSAGLLWCYVELLGGNELLGPFLVAIFIVPVTFTLNKFVLTDHDSL
ncbi:GtrA family protein, partial [bacterium]|nr:GtrA family protein [bacterium]